MASIFISYAHKDLDFVNRLIEDLRNSSIDYWIDHEGITPGSPSWERVIRNAIKDCSAVILVVSQSSVESENVNGEILLAKAYERIVYPIWTQGQNWIDCVPLSMSQHQYIDARNNYETALEELLETLKSAKSFISNLDENPQPIEPKAAPNSLFDAEYSTHSKLIHKLIDIKNYDTARSLIANADWLQVCRAIDDNLYDGYIYDLNTVSKAAQELTHEQIKSGLKPSRLADVFQISLRHTPINSIAHRYPSEFVERALQVEYWTPKHVLSVINKITDSEEKLTLLECFLKSDRLTKNQHQEAEEASLALLKGFIEEQTISGSVVYKIEPIAPLLQSRKAQTQILELALRLHFIEERVHALFLNCVHRKSSASPKLEYFRPFVWLSRYL